MTIIFGSFENITIWQRFNLEISLEESWWGPYLFFHLVTTNLAKFINSSISPNKSSPIIYRYTVLIKTMAVDRYENEQNFFVRKKIS